ncbi:glutathione S-transferase kappa 1 [Aaosphaeria arxii CBS 175.79]|uniref:Glutathione S-transferase kappa n=1 Tax=Aaosphaeria arxii CBS 175.79 TaxID=1450172 RepID=A0A6A5YC39_9PLEO|nr:glutathione S-transferase kappa 1 [Aaosphaeria arxii CBS 175.79]KAF2022204.1 glutathione S-transferase kappa 1 [Aaosphaeria arxii CBS 175.79]
MGGLITCYLDCVSPYSYFALIYLEKHRGLLKSHGVDIDIVPVFLGGINVGSGNKPPWTLPAKASYSQYDNERAKKFFGATNVKTPDFFPILSLLPQRALIYIKSQHPDLFIQAFRDLFVEMWEKGVDVSKPELLAKTFSQHFSKSEVENIIKGANSPEYKQALNDNTKQALDRGAFGCPWFWVKNSEGKEEPFFGSDRFHYMWSYLDLPVRELELLPGGRAKI